MTDLDLDALERDRLESECTRRAIETGELRREREALQGRLDAIVAYCDGDMQSAEAWPVSLKDVAKVVGALAQGKVEP